MNGRGFSFVAGDTGQWRIARIDALRGATLAEASHLAVCDALLPLAAAPEAWTLRGLTSHDRYVTRSEKQALLALPAPPQEPQCAALIAIAKSAEWWAMTQDERRAIFEVQSRHIAIGVELGAGIARRLHHCRDLSCDEPFDFLTWFEYEPADAARFDLLLARLRASEEWRHVTREVDIRLTRT